MTYHHPAGVGCRRPEKGHVKTPVEWIVTPLPVRDADGRRSADCDADGTAPAAGKSAAEPRRGERIAELHRQVRAGVYDSVSTLDTVARRILQSGDL
jgi:hypothetical protein